MSDITVTPQAPLAGTSFVAEAALSNQGGAPAGPFKVQWTVDGRPLPAIAHGPLAPGRRSAEPGVRCTLELGAGRHRLQFIADPEGQVPALDRAHGSFVVEVEVRSPQPADRVVLFDDTFEPGWAEHWSWDTELCEASDPRYSGAAAYQVRYTAPWAGLRLAPVAGSADWRRYRTLRFALNGGPGGGQTVKVRLKTSAGRTLDLGLVSAPAGSWSVVALALPDDPALAGVSELVWQEFAGATPPPLYLDRIELAR